MRQGQKVTRYYVYTQHEFAQLLGLKGTRVALVYVSDGKVNVVTEEGP